jgi:predicted RNase H-like HicB family nuclease
MRFPVIIRRTRTGYSADVPDLPGCIATGKTIRGVRRRMAKAIELHLELMAQSGERIPKPRARVEFDIDATAEEEFGTWVEVSLPLPA